MVPLLVASRSPWKCLSRSILPMAVPPDFSSGACGSSFTSNVPVAWVDWTVMSAPLAGCGMGIGMAAALSVRATQRMMTREDFIGAAHHRLLVEAASIFYGLGDLDCGLQGSAEACVDREAGLWHVRGIEIPPGMKLLD